MYYKVGKGVGKKFIQLKCEIFSLRIFAHI